MILAPMRFKSFVWPHNPKTYTITYERKLAVQKIPMGGYWLQNMGLTRRVLKGEGEFTGADAYDKFKELANLFYEETPGVLVHPVWMTTTAWFAGLELRQRPRRDYVAYSFEFWEVEGGVSAALKTRSLSGGQSGDGGETEPGNTGGTAAQTAYHTVVRGDTLWGISRRYGVALEQIIGLNPDIKNPNLIYVGQKVRIA